ncbi:CubicO group peptidase (beta-lactamase class C family) [Gillisia mitskevichiae]|uniref:CubicO group peptidase (Beta-lactamase class C family) n=1 Tax=Gillisia mitskevichiae TaxID=270921 RepID=A0A495PSC0_9FLAO|nr:serine hydrolase [Gillisia mitskevichiae]RKS53524.1 CubicO group peptidase (beta-lactamase class C family) [Gillisia mitskevichiae]
MFLKSNHALRTFFTCCILALLSNTAMNAQSKAAQIEDLMTLYSEYGQFNGSVLVAEDGEIIYKNGFGKANMEWDIPNDENTKHRLGSITKQFTSMLILLLVEEGKLKLEVPIITYLQDYPKTTGDKITLHHLLTHTSGIPNYTSFPKFFAETSRDPFTPNDFTSLFKDMELEFAPGEKYSYSNSGYFLLGVIIEKVTGKSYEENLQEKIFKPLNMKDTGFDHHDVILKNRASGYQERGNSYSNAPYLDMSIPYSAGSIYSTVEDLYLWDRGLASNKLLSEKNKELLFTPHIKSGDSFYGYGWGVDKMPDGISKDSITIVGHGGGINGFNTIINRTPSKQDLIVLLNNTGGTNLGEMSRNIYKILNGMPYDLPQKSLANFLMEEINKNGLEAGLAAFEKQKAAKEFILKEDDINALGYQFLQSGKLNEAIAVFKLNVTEFPESSNVYDSLGEAYMVAGNKELAILNYKRSVELDPKNENGKEMLKKLQGE